MSTSQCGHICIVLPKCSQKERRRGFSNRTLFGLPNVDAIRNHWLRFVYNTTAQPKCSNLCNEFYGQGWLCTKAISKKRVNSDFAMTIWRF